MRIALIIVGLLVSLAAQPQEIYRWVDKNGTVHYADQPGAPDAKRVEYSARTSAGEPDAAPPLYTPQPSQQPEPAAFRSLSILSPTPDQAFFGGPGVDVPVSVELDGSLRDGDELLIFLDAARVPNVSGMGATLTGLGRGTHFLRAAIIDAAGTIVITSPQITFHVHQASVATPPVGPSVKSPARPSPPGS